MKAGKSDGVDIEILRNRKEGKLQEILSTYRHGDIDNADETGFCRLLLPNHFLGFIGGSYHCAKQPKVPVTMWLLI